MDIDKLVDAVTKVVMDRLNSGDAPKVVRFGDVPDDLLNCGCEVKTGISAADIEGCDYILLTADKFKELHSGSAKTEEPVSVPESAGCDGRTIDLRGKRLVHERDLREQNAMRGDEVLVDKNVIITALAADYARSIGAKFRR